MSLPDRVRGLDGKTYPYRPLRGQARDRLILLVHVLSHEGLSVRQVVAELAETHGITRSVGSVASYLTEHRCPDCSGAESDHLNTEPQEGNPHMTTTQDLLDELAELAAYIAFNVAAIPEHHRRQAVLLLERVERLIPIPDRDVDDLEEVDG